MTKPEFIGEGLKWGTAAAVTPALIFAGLELAVVFGTTQTAITIQNCLLTLCGTKIAEFVGGIAIGDAAFAAGSSGVVLTTTATGHVIVRYGDDIIAEIDSVAGTVRSTLSNQGPYDPVQVRRSLEEIFGAENVTSTTVPGIERVRVNGSDNIRVITDANGGRAVEVDFPHPLTEQVATANIPYNQRGLPILDDVAVFTTTFQREARSATEMREGTAALWNAITAGQLPRESFTPAQLSAIEAGLPQIPGYTWHHNGDTRTLQLVPRVVHEALNPHFGDRSLRNGR